MVRIEWKKEIPMLALLVVFTAAVMWLYPRIPDKLPIHWNIHGAVDVWAAKSWLSVFWSPFLCLIVYVSMLFFPYLDPGKNNVGTFLRVYRWIRSILTIFFMFFSGVVLAAAFNPELPVARMIAGSVSTLLILLGNVIGKIRKNWYVGIKYPATLDNEDVWNRTNRLGGRLFVLSGLLGLISAAVLPLPWVAVIFFGSLLITVVWLAVYSHRLHRALTRK